MAKKNLINADMLLATPRKATEPVVATEVENPVVVPEPQPQPEPLVIAEPIIQTIQAPEIVEETPSQPVTSVKRGLKGNETRATFSVDENLLEKLKAIAYWERLNIKEVVNDIFISYIENYEKQNGRINTIPKK